MRGPGANIQTIVESELLRARAEGSANFPCDVLFGHCWKFGGCFGFLTPTAHIYVTRSNHFPDPFAEKRARFPLQRVFLPMQDSSCSHWRLLFVALGACQMRPHRHQCQRNQPVLSSHHLRVPRAKMSLPFGPRRSTFSTTIGCTSMSLARPPL